VTLSISLAGSLCASGTVGQVKMLDGGMYDYADDWGCGVGTNLNQAPGTNTPNRVLTPSGTGVTLYTTPVPSCTTAHVNVHTAGSLYCAVLTPGVPILWTQFNTQCWSPSTGQFLSGLPSTNDIEVQFNASTTESCPFTDFCITQITFQ
jgi:hypothetical protein